MAVGPGGNDCLKWVSKEPSEETAVSSTFLWVGVVTGVSLCTGLAGCSLRFSGSPAGCPLPQSTRTIQTEQVGLPSLPPLHSRLPAVPSPDTSKRPGCGWPLLGKAPGVQKGLKPARQEVCTLSHQTYFVPQLKEKREEKQKEEGEGKSSSTGPRGCDSRDCGRGQYLTWVLEASWGQ